ncbi:hypothetical protein GA0115256_135831 [Streptomyces sp. DconLS]|nr:MULTISPECIES: hypothetical protein [unclassified Streptomyces]SCF94920.1 hypothetical protein GA0115256_135831 [Streptomyces sp. DconLS]
MAEVGAGPAVAPDRHAAAHRYDGVGGQADRADEPPGGVVTAGGDLLGALVQDVPLVAAPGHPPADPVARLEHAHRSAGARQMEGGGQARDPGSDHGDIDVCVGHQGFFLV